jgi:hypothetical protein
LKFSIVKDHDEPTVLLFETLFCMWECFSMGTELPTKVMLGRTLVLMQMTFLNNARKVGRLVLSRTSCFMIYTLSLVRLLSLQQQAVILNIFCYAGNKTLSFVPCINGWSWRCVCPKLWNHYWFGIMKPYSTVSICHCIAILLLWLQCT